MEKIIILHLSGFQNILFANDIFKKFVTTTPPQKKNTQVGETIIYYLSHTSACKYKGLKQYVR